MIESKDIGLKVAENPEEAFWTQALKRCKDAIFNSEKEIEINKEILKLCNKKLEEQKNLNITKTLN
jgi:hypothetical protein